VVMVNILIGELDICSSDLQAIGRRPVRHLLRESLARRHTPIDGQMCQMGGSVVALPDIVKRLALLWPVIAAILYRSRHPFSLHLYDAGQAGMSHLLGTWRDPPDHRGDLIASILLYIPLGHAAGNVSTGKS